MGYIKLNIYNISDLHGVILESRRSAGLLRTASYLREEIQKDPQAIVLAGGDIYSGTYFAKLSKGKVINLIFNSINLTCLGLGNHELALGEKLKSIEKEASFPFLLANVYNKDNELMFAPYVIKEVGKLKIGIIATLGEKQKDDLTNEIASQIIVTDELETIREYSYHLRRKEKCDLIIVLSHSNDDSLKQKICYFNKKEKVDILITSHTHEVFAYTLTKNKHKLINISSGGYGEYIGKIELTLKRRKIIDSNVNNIATSGLPYNVYYQYQDIISDYIRSNKELWEVAGKVKNNYFKEDFLREVTSYILAKEKADFVLLNYGSIRNIAFPLIEGSEITNSDLYEINPFSNYLYEIEIDRTSLNNYLNKHYSNIYLHCKDILRKEKYNVIVNDFLKDKYFALPLRERKLVKFTDYVREMLEKELL
ncbi:MAG TPA: bifunctional metallophosphatase/5'-nucleotidase [Acholeplasma sp.]|nr:bifunctional metallophosphatase/5'-nucleotidase [Acholeplasma sp.]